jgi:hypothetical protein
MAVQGKTSLLYMQQMANVGNPVFLCKSDMLITTCWVGRFIPFRVFFAPYCTKGMTGWGTQSIGWLALDFVY